MNRRVCNDSIGLLSKTLSLLMLEARAGPEHMLASKYQRPPQRIMQELDRRLIPMKLYVSETGHFCWDLGVKISGLGQPLLDIPIRASVRSASIVWASNGKLIKLDASQWSSNTGPEHLDGARMVFFGFVAQLLTVSRDLRASSG